MPDKKISLSDTLRPVFDKSLQNYLNFTCQPPSLEAKDFTAYHNACKAALAHLMLLEKLIDHTDQSQNQLDLMDLLKQSKQENEHVLFNPDEFS